MYISEIDFNQERHNITNQLTVRYISKVFDDSDNLFGYAIINFKLPEIIKAVDKFFDGNYQSSILMRNSKNELIGKNDAADNDADSSNSVSVSKDLKIANHKYNLEISTDAERIYDESGAANIPFLAVLLTWGLAGGLYTTIRGKSRRDELKAQIKHREAIEVANEALEKEITERKRSEEAWAIIREGITAKTGEAFLSSLASSLAAAINVHYAFISEIVDTKAGNRRPGGNQAASCHARICNHSHNSFNGKYRQRARKTTYGRRMYPTYCQACTVRNDICGNSPVSFKAFLAGT